MLIAINGRKQSGKDTVGKIIQYLTSFPSGTNEDVIKYLNASQGDYQIPKVFTIKKFADKLKDIICILINCTREQLEDESFKNTELSEEWWYWKENITGKIVKPFKEKEINDFILVKPTPRFLLQFIGTDLLRNQLHPEIWVNSLMNKYFCVQSDLAPNGIDCPNWIITDVRFLNEMEAVKKRDGITIRVNRDLEKSKDEHESETELDNVEFDYVIDNNGTIKELIEKVRQILIKEKLI